MGDVIDFRRPETVQVVAQLGQSEACIFCFAGRGYAFVRNSPQGDGHAMNVAQLREFIVELHRLEQVLACQRGPEFDPEDCG